MSRRRAASDALSSSVDIWPSFVKAKSTAENLDLLLDLGEHGEVVGVDEDVPAVLERREQIERLFQGVGDVVWRTPWR
jgi:hypothetical protein